MEKYLTSLLELNSRVIVPDLGAFIIRQQDPKELVFNDLLSFDDGMLTEFLIRDEKLSKTEAQNRIQQFVEKVKKVLQKGDNYHLENLGTLTMDASSRINFATSDAPVESAPEAGPDAEEEVPEEPPAEAVPEPAAAEEPEAAPDAEKEVPVGDSETERVKAASGETPDTEITEEGEEGVFELQGEDAEVDIDASDEDADQVKPEPETRTQEPPFQIEEQETETEAGQQAAEEEMVEKEKEKELEQLNSVLAEMENEVEEESEQEIPEQFRHALAEEPAGDESVSIEEFLEKEQERNKVKVEGVPVNLEPDDTSFSTYAQSPRRRRAWPWVLGSLLLVTVILMAGGYFYPGTFGRILPEKLMQKLAGLKSRNAEESVAPAEGSMGTASEATGSLPEDTEQAVGSGEVAEPSGGSADAKGVPETAGASESRESQPVTRPADGGKRYYLVAGCFADLGNAESYVRTLRAQGYDASIFGKRDNLHAVCFSSHSSRQAANEELKRIRSTYDPAAWVLYY